MPKIPAELEYIIARPYSRILVPDGSGRYFAEILEFPGCFSEGDTPNEAIENLNEAMASWIEVALEDGQTIPEPIQGRPRPRTKEDADA